MKTHRLTKAFHLVAASSLLLPSGCATAFLRSQGAVAAQQVFPATVFDAQFFWRSGVQGEPLFAMADPKARQNPVARFACGVGSIIDLPFSLGFDTILLPFDLSRGGITDTEDKREPAGAMK